MSSENIFFNEVNYVSTYSLTQVVLNIEYFIFTPPRNKEGIILKTYEQTDLKILFSSFFWVCYEKKKAK